MPVVPNNVQITLKFNNDGTLSGFSGCNNYNGGYKLTGNTTEFGKTITIGPLASTAMYCADTANLESSYLSILQQTKTYSITNDKMLPQGRWFSRVVVRQGLRTDNPQIFFDFSVIHVREYQQKKRLCRNRHEQSVRTQNKKIV